MKHRNLLLSACGVALAATLSALAFNGATVEQLGLEVPVEVLEAATVTSEAPY